jgi:hypothetical protein
MPTPKPEAVYRTCPACGGTRFRLVGYQNATYLVCERTAGVRYLGAGACRSRPFLSSQKGHLERDAMRPQDIADFKALLGGAEPK